MYLPKYKNISFSALLALSHLIAYNIKKTLLLTSLCVFCCKKGIKEWEKERKKTGNWTTTEKKINLTVVTNAAAAV